VPPIRKSKKSLKIELHLHTSRYSPCATATPEELMERLIRTGYDAVYITEHDAVWSPWELIELQRKFPGIRIFGGVEISTPPTGEGMQHLLVLGTSDRGYLDSSENTAEILTRARREGCLTVLAHPFRWPAAAAMLEQGLVPDALEYHTCNHGDEEAKQALAAAQRLKISAVNAGDVHDRGFIDRFWIETDLPLVDGKSIRGIVKSGLYRNCMKED
jgi:DNA polymerase III alpha subunit